MKKAFILASIMLFATGIFGRSRIADDAVESLMVSEIMYAMSQGGDYHEGLKTLASRHVDDKKPLRPLTLEMLGSYVVELAEIESSPQQELMLPLLQEVKKQDAALVLRIQRIEKHFEENVDLQNLLKNYNVVDVDAISPFHAEDPVKTKAMKDKKIIIPDVFNGLDYKQNYADSACDFLSTLAGIMYTNQGRASIKELLLGQDADYIYFKFHAPLEWNNKNIYNDEGGAFDRGDQERYVTFCKAFNKKVYKVKKTSKTVDAYYPQTTAGWVHLLMRAYEGFADTVHQKNMHAANQWSLDPFFILPSLDGIDYRFSVLTGKKIKQWGAVLNPADKLKETLLSGNYIRVGGNVHASVFLVDGNKELLFYDNQVGNPQPVNEFKGKKIKEMAEGDFFNTLLKEIRSRGIQPYFESLY